MRLLHPSMPLVPSAGSDNPTTPPHHLARVLRRLATPHQTTGFLLQCQRRYGNAYVRRMVLAAIKNTLCHWNKESDGAEPIARRKSAGKALSLSDSSVQAGADVDDPVCSRAKEADPRPKTMRVT